MANGTTGRRVDVHNRTVQGITWQNGAVVKQIRRAKFMRARRQVRSQGGTRARANVVLEFNGFDTRGLLQFDPRICRSRKNPQPACGQDLVIIEGYERAAANESGSMVAGTHCARYTAEER